MKRPRSSFRVEPLEPRTLLSASPWPPAAASAAAQVQVAAAQAATLAGTIRGMYAFTSGIPDVGSTLRLSGSGRVQGLGPVRASGSVATTGFIASGHAGGTLTLSNPRGSVVLVLQGPTQPGFSPPPG